MIYKMTTRILTSNFSVEYNSLYSLSQRNAKFCLVASLYDFLTYTQNNANFDVYDVSSNPLAPRLSRFELILRLNYYRDNLIYFMYLNLPKYQRGKLLSNVIVHTGRKIMKANNPALDIFIFDFNRG